MTGLQQRVYRPIAPGDVGSRVIVAFGRRWHIAQFIGVILDRDIGKRLYFVTAKDALDKIELETDGQRRKRLYASRVASSDDAAA